LGIYSSLTNSSLEKSVKDFQGKNFSEFKESLSQVLVEKIGPISNEIKKLINNKDFLDKILIDGHKKANDIASNKVKKIHELIGF
jgi:tryptophanyl-tRNA synthetase